MRRAPLALIPAGALILSLLVLLVLTWDNAPSRREQERIQGLQLCVGRVPGCTGRQYAPRELTRALRDARAVGQRVVVHLAPGRYRGNVSLDAPTPVLGHRPQVIIAGAGVGRTVLQGTQARPGAPPITLQLNGTYVRDLTVIGAGEGMALALTNRARAERVHVVDPPMRAGIGAMVARGSTLAHSSVDASGADAIGIYATDGPATIENVSVSGSGGMGIMARFDPSAPGSSTLDVSRVTLRGFRMLLSAEHVRLRLSDSLLDLGTVPGSVGLFLTSETEEEMVVSRTSIIGRHARQGGANLAGGIVRLEDSVVQVLGGAALQCQADSIPVRLSLVRVVLSGPLTSVDGSTFCILTQEDVTENAGAVLTPTGMPRADSVVIDTGSAAVSAGRDARGAPRVQDGDKDGTPRVDRGALERAPGG